MQRKLISQRKNKGKVYKHTYTRGIDIGDYYFEVVNSNGDHLKKFGNREINSAINFLKTL